MTMSADRPRRSRRSRESEPKPERQVNYRNLRNPFPMMPAFSDDRIAAIHAAALDVLEDLGVRILLPEARQILRQAGARIDEDDQMVFIGRDLVEAAVESAPRSFTARGGSAATDVRVEPGSLIFQPGAAAPHATDLKRGRRPGTIADFRELVLLTQHFDVLHMVPTLIEPQDVPVNVRHYAMTEAFLTLSDKVPFFYSRGTPQAEDNFEMIRIARGWSDDEFLKTVCCYTIINTNSPRQIDIPMAQGLIDFARAGQMTIVTPFTLMGAMAPITVAGAMTLSHAEALAAITLNQLARPGAPVCYGTFTSNVDMKSGAPAFGTPEHFTASLCAGQLARLLDLPWRCASGSAANVADAQAANETQFGLWGCLLGGATINVHAAGWMEGGLTVSYEKLVTDVEVLQMVAELCTETSADDDEIGFDALKEVQPGGHFFAAGHTMERYRTAFYEPFVHDWSNFGTWSERGARDASVRATDIWQTIVADGSKIDLDETRAGELRAFIERRTAEGGAHPES